ncbi:serrate RNA effector molecule homolog isoform X1 [Esox lucius]|uniref:serrate RNA effector molecule homolog isoform X1 n=1 Tax=Esox lucius TaxID=8010 RepID=UPI0005779730|nr:serrate RNA effector molecule homolog isoform X1 [Esox lucius]XP_010866590.1 serrate RNA effector molecule homolog isoform X1 [Esox lucius]
MGDSDDEFDRRRRDKFRRERSDLDRSREREDRRREDWPESVCLYREWDRGRERRRDYERGRRERFSPPRHISPQHKRMRRDWDDHRGDPYRGGYDLPYGGAGPHYGGGHPGHPGAWVHPDMPPMHGHHGHPLQGRLGGLPDDLPPPGHGPPTMRSFKDFLLSMDDSVDETEAVKRYNQYKLDYRRQQLQDFFLQHKDEEWFRSKYHPDEVGLRKVESKAALKSRLGVFLFLLDNGWLDSLSLDMEHAPSIVKLMDAAVIKMEGGTDHDLQVLEAPPPGETVVEMAPAGEDKEKAAPLPKTEESPESPKETPTHPDLKEKQDGQETKQNGEKEEGEEGEEREEGEEEEKTTMKKPKEDVEPKKGRKRKRSVSADSEEGSGSDSDSSHSDKHEEEEDREEEEEEGEEGGERRKERQKERGREQAPPRPRPLHLTTSLFMRSLAPSISKEEITALCRRYPGFLRVALSDPQPERRFYRRCWVTFDRSVNIKETCWNLQNIRLRDCELAPVVNRDLARRVRNVSGLTQHRPVLRNDIKLSARLIQALDERGSLWGGLGEDEDEEEEEEGERQFPDSNPVLRNITDYLIEEVSAEEEELMGVNASNDPSDPSDSTPGEVTVETDEKLIKVLDRLLLYLRLVHSVDYYNSCEYPAEDEMPHRCGLIHVRGPVPPNRVTQNEVSEWQRVVEERLAPLFSVCESVSEEEAVRLGKKDPEAEVEKFLTANTQELGKDKWLCPLSGKKFKAPEFVRKHILNKHGDKVTQVRQEVEFFNNFLLDAKRPALPEAKPLPPPSHTQGVPPAGIHGYPGQAPQQSLLGFPPQPRLPMSGFPGGPPYPNQFGAGRGNYDNFRGHGGGGGGYPGKPARTPGRGVRGDPRSIIEYRDLDAPDDMDFF